MKRTIDEEVAAATVASHNMAISETMMTTIFIAVVMAVAVAEAVVVLAPYLSFLQPFYLPLSH